MLRVVLDANQFVSALLKSGSNSAKIIALVRDERIKLLLSEPIISEITGVLLYPKIRKRHGRSPEFIVEFMKRLRSVAVIAEGRLRIEAVKHDPSDDIYLECAVEGHADFIVSGDRHLKDLESFKGIRILDPATFLVEMRKRG